MKSEEAQLVKDIGDKTIGEETVKKEAQKVNRLALGFQLSADMYYAESIFYILPFRLCRPSAFISLSKLTFQKPWRTSTATELESPQACQMERLIFEPKRAQMRYRNL